MLYNSYMLRRIPGLQDNQELRHSKRQKQELTYVLDPLRDFNTVSLHVPSVPNSSHLLDLQESFGRTQSASSLKVTAAHFYEII